MKLVSLTAALAIATLALAPIANAADARLVDCIQMAKKVSAALDVAQPGTSTDQARDQANVGRHYCASRLYAEGVAHYSMALQLLAKG
jgi:hypothetical protein